MRDIKRTPAPGYLPCNRECLKHAGSGNSEDLTMVTGEDRERLIRTAAKAYGHEYGGFMASLLDAGADAQKACLSCKRVYDAGGLPRHSISTNDEAFLADLHNAIAGRPSRVADMRPIELASQFLAAKGRVPNDVSEVATIFAGARRIHVTASAQTVDDFPSAMGAATCRFLVERWATSELSMHKVARRIDRPSFGENVGVRPAVSRAWKRCRKAAPTGVWTTIAETSNLDSYARIVSISRRAIVNDMIGSLRTIGEQLADAARQTEADLLFAALYGPDGNGATMSDGKALFHTDHGNVATSGAEPSVSTVATGMQAMLAQRDASSGSAPLRAHG
jgi:hypothetical protein